MQRYDAAVIAAVITCIAGLAINSYLSVHAMWGFNHLAYLSPWFILILVGTAIMSGLLLLVGSAAQTAKSLLERAARYLWERGRLPGLVIVLLFIALFWVLRAQIHLLGDGYRIVNLYAEPVTRVKLTSFGSIYLLRGIQWLLGGYTAETSLLAFQILSVVSGGIAIYGFLDIARWLTEKSALRAVVFLLLLTSGATLLFFGYTELYPPLWAAASLFFAASLRYLRTDRGYVAVVGLFLLMVVLHLQSLLLIIAVVYLPLRRLHTALQRPHATKYVVTTGVIFLIAGLTAYTWLYSESLIFRDTFLPVFKWGLQSTNYGVLTLPHLRDIVNLVLVIIPAAPLLLVGFIKAKGRLLHDRLPVFLILCGVSLGLFLLTAEPDLGMAADWDLMSLTVFPWLLLLLWGAANAGPAMSISHVAAAVVIALCATSLYLTANLDRQSAEDRYYALLQHYGSLNRGSWVMFHNYYLKMGDSQRAAEIRAEADTLFRDYKMLDDAYALSKSGRAAEAYPVAAAVLGRIPDDPYAMQVMADIQMQLGNLQRAESLYVQTLKLRPFLSDIKAKLSNIYMLRGQPGRAVALLEEARELAPDNVKIAEGLGLAYFSEGRIDSVEAMSNELLSDPHSASGHALGILAAMSHDDTAHARQHYVQFLEYGKTRKDFDELTAYYGPLLGIAQDSDQDIRPEAGGTP